MEIKNKIYRAHTPDDEMSVCARLLGKILLAFLWIVSIWSYSWTDNPLHLSVYNLRLSWDQWIPLWPSLTVPYLLFYPYLLITLGYSFFRSTAIYVTFTLAGILAFNLANLCFVFLPTEIIRPTDLGDSYFAPVLEWTYSVLPPRNTFPSEHTTGAILCGLAWISLKSRLAPYTTLLSLVIISATVLLHQHYLIDLLSATVFSLICYFSTAGYVLGWSHPGSKKRS
jgi:hypothetical protein